MQIPILFAFYTNETFPITFTQKSFRTHSEGGAASDTKFIEFIAELDLADQP